MKRKPWGRLSHHRRFFIHTQPGLARRRSRAALPHALSRRVSLSQSPELLARVEARSRRSARRSTSAAVRGRVRPRWRRRTRSTSSCARRRRTWRGGGARTCQRRSVPAAGTVLRRTGDEAGTRRAYGAALALDPSFGLAYFNLGNMLPRGEQLKMYELAAELDPTHRGAWMNLANAHRRPAASRSSSRRCDGWQDRPGGGRSRLTGCAAAEPGWRRCGSARPTPRRRAPSGRVAEVEAAAAGRCRRKSWAPLSRARGGGACQRRRSAVDRTTACSRGRRPSIGGGLLQRRSPR